MLLETNDVLLNEIIRSDPSSEAKLITFTSRMLDYC